MFLVRNQELVFSEKKKLLAKLWLLENRVNLDKTERFNHGLTYLFHSDVSGSSFLRLRLEFR